MRAVWAAAATGDERAGKQRWGRKPHPATTNIPTPVSPHPGPVIRRSCSPSAFPQSLRSPARASRPPTSAALHKTLVWRAPLLSSLAIAPPPLPGSNPIPDHRRRDPIWYAWGPQQLRDIPCSVPLLPFSAALRRIGRKRKRQGRQGRRSSPPPPRQWQQLVSAPTLAAYCCHPYIPSRRTPHRQSTPSLRPPPPFPSFPAAAGRIGATHTLHPNPLASSLPPFVSQSFDDTVRAFLRSSRASLFSDQTETDTMAAPLARWPSATDDSTWDLVKRVCPGVQGRGGSLESSPLIPPSPFPPPPPTPNPRMLFAEGRVLTFLRLLPATTASATATRTPARRTPCRRLPRPGRPW